jgi:hypothetical protein
MAKERQFYDKVVKFLGQEFGCFEVKKEVGTALGIIDVLGIRRVSKDLAFRYELISVEVKEQNARYLNSVGQALAYSVCTHRCFLAYHMPRSRKFSQAEMDIADHFGIGLISLSKSKEPKLVRSSSLFNPKIEYTTWLIDKLDQFTCALCGGIFKQVEIVNINQPGKIIPTDNSSYLGKLGEAITKRKNAKWFLFEMAEEMGEKRGYIYDRRYLCKDCVSIFASLNKPV